MKLFTLSQAPVALLALAALLPSAQAAKPTELLAEYTAKAGAPASPERGQKLFTTKGTGDMGWSCASCHGNTPTSAGRNALSEKPIPALAPAFNPTSFTDRSKVDGWFKNNCKDVLSRECTVAEKADVLSWLLTLKP
ncbi:MAG: DUF1924 domain-containing protein [Rubrivivax sp.]|nr:DUF1924 domain-containing protein [Rubrivivax sp.]